MHLDRGNTTFDLQATTFTELFEAIKNSHTRPYREERTGRDIMYEMWEQEDMNASHTENE